MRFFYAPRDRAKIISAMRPPNSIHRYITLLKGFLNVSPVLGNKLYFIASDGPLSVSFSMLSIESGIENQYVNSYYFIDELTEEKSGQIVKNIDKR